MLNLCRCNFSICRTDAIYENKIEEDICKSYQSTIVPSCGEQNQWSSPWPLCHLHRMKCNSHSSLSWQIPSTTALNCYWNLLQKVLLSKVFGCGTTKHLPMLKKQRPASGPIASKVFTAAGRSNCCRLDRHISASFIPSQVQLLQLLSLQVVQNIWGRVLGHVAFQTTSFFPL